jgi:pyruvate/2-oxoglutarate dehydrogenase complex dihydrolipoamide acyltransferase (E2) component
VTAQALEVRMRTEELREQKGESMLVRTNSVRLIPLLFVLAVMIVWIAAAPVAGADLAPPLQETPSAEEPEATAPPEEPEPTEPPAEEPAPEEPPAEPAPPQGGLGRWGTLVTWAILGVVGVTVIAIIVVLLSRPGKGEEAPAEVPSVPITTLAEDIKEGRVSKVVVSGGDLNITRIDGLVMVSHKEPTADLVQLLTNLGVTPEMMSKIVIEVETP